MRDKRLRELLGFKVFVGCFGPPYLKLEKLEKIEEKIDLLAEYLKVEFVNQKIKGYKKIIKTKKK